MALDDTLLLTRLDVPSLTYGHCAEPNGNRVALSGWRLNYHTTRLLTSLSCGNYVSVEQT
jgi:hypothetical protein